MKVYVAEKPKLGKAMVQVLSKTSPITNRGGLLRKEMVGRFAGLRGTFLRSKSPITTSELLSQAPRRARTASSNGVGITCRSSLGRAIYQGGR